MQAPVRYLAESINADQPTLGYTQHRRRQMIVFVGILSSTHLWSIKDMPVKKEGRDKK